MGDGFVISQARLSYLEREKESGESWTTMMAKKDTHSITFTHSCIQIKLVCSIGRGLGRRLDNATAKQLAVRITILIRRLIWEYNIISVRVKFMNGNANILHSQIDHHMWMSTVNTSILFVNILFLIFMLYIFMFMYAKQLAVMVIEWC